MAKRISKFLGDYDRQLGDPRSPPAQSAGETGTIEKHCLSVQHYRVFFSVSAHHLDRLDVNDDEPDAEPPGSRQKTRDFLQRCHDQAAWKHARILRQLFPECLSRASAISMISTVRFPRLIAGIVGLGLLCLSGMAAAHPHVWIRYTAKLDMHDTSIASIAETWRFTEGFPVQMVGIDTLTKNGPLDEAQTAIFKEKAFSSLAGAGYFTHLYIDGQPQRFKTPTDFHVAVRDGKIEYSFVIALSVPTSAKGRRVVLGIWDPSFFVEYETEDDAAVTLGSQAGKNCKVDAFTDHDHPIFNGMVAPKAMAISC